MDKFGNDWPSVVNYIGTRTAPQVRSHAQKYYARLRNNAKEKIKKDPQSTKVVFAITHEFRKQAKTVKSAIKRNLENDNMNFPYPYMQQTIPPTFKNLVPHPFLTKQLTFTYQ